MSDAPTAGVVAAAIVAACRQTGEDPEDVARGKLMLRARHYALHALARAFPDVGHGALARLLGCRRNPGHFASNSRTAIADPNSDPPRRKAHWWSDEAFHRVWRAVEAAASAQASARVEPPPSGAEPAPGNLQPYRPPPGAAQKMLEPKPDRGALGHDGYRPPPDAIRRALEDDDEDDGPVLSRSAFVEPRSPRFLQPEGKRALHDLLAEAAANTARLPKGD